MKKLLKSEICRFVNSTSVHCSRENWSKVAAEAKKKREKRKKKKENTHSRKRNAKTWDPNRPIVLNNLVIVKKKNPYSYMLPPLKKYEFGLPPYFFN